MAHNGTSILLRLTGRPRPAVSAGILLIAPTDLIGTIQQMTGTPTIIATSGGSFGELIGTYYSDEHEPGKYNHPKETAPIDELIMSKVQNKLPKVLCITTGSDPRMKNTAEFDNALTNRFKRAGAHSVDIMMLTYYRPQDSIIKDKMQQADIIYISGGTSHLLNATLKRRGVDVLLKEAALSGKILCGLSAGLCCWFSKINASVTFEDIVTAEGLSWMDAYIAPHWNTEPHRHKPFHQTVLDNPGLIGLAFDEHTAIEIQGDRYRLHRFGPGGNVYRAQYYDKTGHYSFYPLEFSEDLEPIDDLGIVHNSDKALVRN